MRTFKEEQFIREYRFKESQLKESSAKIKALGEALKSEKLLLRRIEKSVESKLKELDLLEDTEEELREYLQSHKVKFVNTIDFIKKADKILQAQVELLKMKKEFKKEFAN